MATTPVKDKNMLRICQIMNEDIGHLYASAIQYKQHASLLEGVFTQLEADLKEHADDDLQQAAWLTEKVSFYNEIPSITVAPIISATPSLVSLELLISDLITITNAVNRFRRHLAEITQMGVEFGSVRKFYEEMLDHEEEHLNSFKNFLSPYMKESDPAGDLDSSFTDTQIVDVVKLANIIRG